MADFNFYLNRQGVQGRQGAKGDTGFSPIITELVNDRTTYKLNIQNESFSFETPNLRPEINDGEGSYIRINPEGGWYIGDPNPATETDLGMVRLASEDEFTVDIDNKVTTPSVIITNLTNYIETSGAITKTVDESGKITLNTADFSDSIQSLNSRLNDEIQYRINGDSSLNTQIGALRDQLTTESQIRLNADTQQQTAIDAERLERETQDAALQNQLSTKLTADNIKAGSNVTITKDGNNVTINSTGGGGGSGDVTAAGNNNFTGYNTFDKAIQSDGYNTTKGVYTSRGIYIDKYPAIKMYADSILVPDDIVPPELGNVDLDLNIVNNTNGSIKFNKTPKVLDDIVLTQANVRGSETIDVSVTFDGIELNANLDEIGGEVNTLSNRVNTVENELGTIVERMDSLVLYKFPNATIIGEPTINNGQITNFTANNYLQFPFEFETKGRTWLLNGSFDTRGNVNTQQNIIDSSASVALAIRNGRLILALSTNGISFNLGEHQSMSDIEINTKYYFRLSFSGTQYLLSLSTDKETYLPEIIVSSTEPIASNTNTISSSNHPFNGTINLNDWNLTVANTLVWQGMDDVGIASRLDVNASNLTQTGLENLKRLLGLNNLESVIDDINGEVI